MYAGGVTIEWEAKCNFFTRSLFIPHPMVWKKCSRVSYNTSGLRNQKEQGSETVETPVKHSLENGNDESDDEDWHANLWWDSLKPVVDSEEEDVKENCNNNGEMEEWDSQWDDNLNSEGLQARLVKWAIENGDDPCNEEWILTKLREKRAWKSMESVCHSIKPRLSRLTHFACVHRLSKRIQEGPRCWLKIRAHTAMLLQALEEPNTAGWVHNS